MLKVGDRVHWLTRPEIATVYKVSKKGFSIYLIWDDLPYPPILGPYKANDLHKIKDGNLIMKDLCTK